LQLVTRDDSATNDAVDCESATPTTISAAAL
jgi:hypothetical protein